MSAAVASTRVEVVEVPHTLQRRSRAQLQAE
jgi:hypothetical protein